MSGFVWDPDPVAFVIPYTHCSVRWYGLLFALGFFFAYLLFRKACLEYLKGRDMHPITAKEVANNIADRVLVVFVVMILVMARLGEVFFYNWTHYRLHPLDIIKLWQGGLSSHGAGCGGFAATILLVRWFHSRYSWLTTWVLMDLLTVSVFVVSGCIRLGNFMNQELTGKVTSLPWGVIFGHPMDGLPGVPLHPVPLYECMSYVVGLGLLLSWPKYKYYVGTGVGAGCYFFLVFTVRLGCEGLKNPQNLYFDTHAPIMMGQLLSIPYILLGVYFLYHAYRIIKRRETAMPKPF